MRSRQQKSTKKRALMALIVFVILLGGILVINNAKYIPFFLQLSFNKGIQLKETKEKRVNLLVLGVGGGTHDGPDLTDTIIFASIDPNTKKVTLVSLPRDLWIPELKAKVNTAYTYGEEKQKGGGLLLAKATISKVIGQQIDYGIKIDFNGFIKAVNMVGGLDITVDNTFDDYQYPITGKEDETCGHTDQEIKDLSSQIASGSASEVDSFPCRYEHLHFDKGLTYMDGITALKYVRSRHAEGVEGSDFARSKRQEKVISEFKQKVLSVDTFMNPVKAISLFNIFKDNIDTDINPDEMDDFIRLAQKLKGASIKSTVIDTGDEAAKRLGLLLTPQISQEYGNQWVVAPRAGNENYSEIQQYVACEINVGNCIVGANSILTPTPIQSGQTPEVTSAVKRNP